MNISFYQGKEKLCIDGGEFQVEVLCYKYNK